MLDLKISTLQQNLNAENLLSIYRMVLKASSEFLGGDATKGAKLFKQHCSRCHKVEKV